MEIASFPKVPFKCMVMLTNQKFSIPAKLYCFSEGHLFKIKREWLLQHRLFDLDPTLVPVRDNHLFDELYYVRRYSPQLEGVVDAEVYRDAKEGIVMLNWNSELIQDYTKVLCSSLHPEDFWFSVSYLCLFMTTLCDILDPICELFTDINKTVENWKAPIPYSYWVDKAKLEITGSINEITFKVIDFSVPIDLNHITIKVGGPIKYRKNKTFDHTMASKLGKSYSGKLFQHGELSRYYMNIFQQKLDELHMTRLQMNTPSTEKVTAPLIDRVISQVAYYVNSLSAALLFFMPGADNQTENINNVPEALRFNVLHINWLGQRKERILVFGKDKFWRTLVDGTVRQTFFYTNLKIVYMLVEEDIFVFRFKDCTEDQHFVGNTSDLSLVRYLLKGRDIPLKFRSTSAALKLELSYNKQQ